MKESRAFEEVSRGASWVRLLSTYVMMLISLAGAGALGVWFWPAAIPVAILSGLLIVRGFILYHDFLHGAILRGSRFARVIFTIYGWLVLTPPEAWRRSHNHHHGHIGKLDDGAAPGEFPLMTTEQWRAASAWKRFQYRVSRHPLIILFAYGTIFGWSLCLRTFLQNPKLYAGSGIALVLHAGLIVLVWSLLGFGSALFGVILPMVVATALGGLLFFLQHSFDGAHVHDADEWTFHDAAIDSSSYLDLGPVMHWFTGNIGYHHVHHLNHRIPFYRLPQAMKAIPELQAPPTVRPRVREIALAFHRCLWDPAAARMVSIREAAG
jgi:omega-6 fatty acid desaturase (delta-12 desaturase)